MSGARLLLLQPAKTSNHWLLLLIALRELSEMMASSIASYLTELLAKVLAGKVGLEPTLFWLTVSSLYHISSIPIMLLLLDLNQWPLGCKPSILTTELRSIDRAVSLTSNYPKEGPSKSSTLWKHENIVWRMRDLNPELLLAREVC